MRLAEIHPVQSLLFDLDGTLIDSCPGIASSLAMAFRAAGRTMPPADLRVVIGPPIRAIAMRIDPTLTEAELAQIETAYRNDYDTNGWRETVLFDEVVRGLQQLRKLGVQLFLITNKPKVPTNRIVTHFGITDLFEEIVTRDSRAPSYSGKSEMLSELLLRHGLRAESTVMVGDTAEDAEAAEINGLDFIHASYGYGSIGNPRRSIASFSELWGALSARDQQKECDPHA
jgi:phosphoglycolate phosphatase